jgi:hypothetical protein
MRHSFARRMLLWENVLANKKSALSRRQIGVMGDNSAMCSLLTRPIPIGGLRLAEANERRRAVRTNGLRRQRLP